MNRGEIWWADLPEPRCSEPGFRRPVLVVQANRFNQSRIETIVCLALSTNLHLLNAPGNVFLSKKESNLPQDSVINISQIMTIDRDFFLECGGSVDRSLMKKVEAGLKLILEIA